MLSQRAIWNKYQGLKWPWKVLLAIFFVAATILVSFVYVFWRAKDHIANEEVVQQNKRKTDRAVQKYLEEDARLSWKRQESKKKLREIKSRVEKNNEEHMLDIEVICRADCDELLRERKRLRERNNKRRRRSSTRRGD